MYLHLKGPTQTDSNANLSRKRKQRLSPKEKDQFLRQGAWQVVIKT